MKFAIVGAALLIAGCSQPADDYAKERGQWCTKANVSNPSVCVDFCVKSTKSYAGERTCMEGVVSVQAIQEP